MTGLIDDRCPCCRQKMPDMASEKTRICFDCQKPIVTGDKWRLKRITVPVGAPHTDSYAEKKATVYVHRHCDNPQSYKPRAA